MPGAAACISPWTDLTMSTPSMDADTERTCSTASACQWYADRYLPGGTDPREPLVSPRFADLAGLPPWSSTRRTTRCWSTTPGWWPRPSRPRVATVEYRTWPEAFHVFHATAGLTPEADEAVAAMGPS